MTSPSVNALKAVDIARAQIGKRYVWGASGPNTFDCSGLTWYAYQHAGHLWPRMNDSGQAAHGIRVSQQNLLPGDLVRPHVGHIQIYSSRGNIIEAPSAGHPVRERSMWGFYDGTRIIPAGVGTIPKFPGTTHIGMSGTDVRTVQQRLADRGWNVVVDGIFGPATDRMVRNFQAFAHLTRDGIVGSRTWNALWSMPIV